MQSCRQRSQAVAIITTLPGFHGSQVNRRRTMCYSSFYVGYRA
ncbi:unnamed protein product [Musa acuminata subsp. burmannicoides]